MNNTYISLSSLAMDLKRVALSYHSGSKNTAARFLEEAIKRKSEINKDKVKPYLRRFLKDVDGVSQLKDDQDKAEKALLLSLLFQNAALVR